ncbi:chitin synthase-domain-containing protein [Mycena leptocephala]|nr:chitin synthase-domain-containing protein [Mycena leptocephala]
MASHQQEYQDPIQHMDHAQSTSQVELVEGNLVLDVKVAPKDFAKHKAKFEEISEMRYTAATCGPDDFMRFKYSLRPVLCQRHTKLSIVMTMYTESEVLFINTMNAYDVTTHIFKYTSKVVIDLTKQDTLQPFEWGPHPVQILFCLKEQNKKKLNSHRWFFNAFCPFISPEVCILLDVGTKPTDTSIYELWKFRPMKCRTQQTSNSATTQASTTIPTICVDTGSYCSLLLTSPLAASQNFEYKMSNVLDQPFESVFAYISVLPGAFSAYRYNALLEGQDKKGPLVTYFKGEGVHDDRDSKAGLFGALSFSFPRRSHFVFEIVTKKDEKWILKYVKSAKSSTDVPTSVAEFISQRRRWLNGSLFAEQLPRKIFLTLEVIYNFVQFSFTWTSLANFYLAFFFIVGSATSNQATDAFNFLSVSAGREVFELSLKLYISLLFVATVCSLGNRPQGFESMYIAAILLFGVCNIITVWCMAFIVHLSVASVPAEEWRHVGKLLETNTTFRDIVISVLATYGIYFMINASTKRT